MSTTLKKSSNHTIHKLKIRFGIEARHKQYHQICQLIRHGKFREECEILTEDNGCSIWEIIVNDIVCWFVWDGERIRTVLDQEAITRKLSQKNGIIERKPILTLWGLT